MSLSVDWWVRSVKHTLPSRESLHTIHPVGRFWSLSVHRYPTSIYSKAATFIILVTQACLQNLFTFDSLSKKRIYKEPLLEFWRGFQLPKRSSRRVSLSLSLWKRDIWLPNFCQNFEVRKTVNESLATAFSLRTHLCVCIVCQQTEIVTLLSV